MSEVSDLALVLRGTDAAGLAHLRDDATPLVVALTPDAQVAVQRAGHAFVSSDELFTDTDHASCAQRTDALMTRVDAVLADYADLCPSAAHALRRDVFRLGAMAHRAWHLLGHGQGWWVPDGEQRFEHTVEREVAHTRLLAHVIASFGTFGAMRPSSPPLFGFFRAVRRLQVALLRARSAWVVSSSYKTTFDLIAMLADLRPPVGHVVVALETGGMRAWRRLATGIARALLPGTRQATVPVVLAPVSDTDVEGVVDAVFGGLGDPVAKRAVDMARTGLLNRLQFAIALRTDDLRVLEDLRPIGAIEYDTNGLLAGPLLDATVSMRLPAVCLNHNSFPAAAPPLPALVLRSLARLRVAPRLCSDVLVWSRATRDELVATRLSDAARERVHPVRAYDVTAPPDPAPAAGVPPRCLVLHAGNSSTWVDFLPVIVETTDEFVASTRKLAEAVATLDGVDVEIRLRFKPELSAATLTALVPGAPNVRITGPEIDFLSRLVACDLLVSYYSTTVEQALHYRKPVLLWGPVARFSQLAGRNTEPTPSDRAAVYAVSEPARLPAMLRAIVDAHRGRPLTDAELAPYVWPASVPGFAEVAAAIERGHRQAQASPAASASGRATFLYEALDHASANAAGIAGEPDRR